MYLLQYAVSLPPGPDYDLPPGPEYDLRRILFIGIDRIIDYMKIASCVLSDMRKEIGL